MYQQFFGLTKEPFAMTPDPAFLFLTTAHREALAGLTYAVLSRKGFVVLTGQAGTGKTTLLSRMLQSIPASRARFSVVLNPTLTPSEFLELALIDFGLTHVPSSKAQRLVLLQKFLVEARTEGKLSVLVLDEAHKLAPDVLEEIRLLGNFEMADAKLLQIVMAGQTELASVLNRDDLRQLKQRISVRLAIHPLSRSDVEKYIQHRWSKAGATKPHPFSPDAVERIVQLSSGIPRLVNVLCDNALTLAYGEGVATISARHIAEVASDFDLVETRGRSNGSPRATAQRGPAANRADWISGGANSVPANSLSAIERYIPQPSKSSRLMRWVARFRTAEVRERHYEQNI